jgi:hypothetical protein
MSPMIRVGFAALGLIAGVVQMAHAATYSRPQQPVAKQQIPQDTTNAQTDRTYAF